MKILKKTIGTIADSPKVAKKAIGKQTDEFIEKQLEKESGKLNKQLDKETNKFIAENLPILIEKGTLVVTVAVTTGITNFIANTVSSDDVFVTRCINLFTRQVFSSSLIASVIFLAYLGKLELRCLVLSIAVLAIINQCIHFLSTINNYSQNPNNATA